ncbi:ankyrin repeat domain-containing protein [Acidobacterium sp. S8]|uniref:ankyrin repeat domain-containing protein n=1 Tax=Acidobacterium sp. S8 TaxID=1641854 RepID=UPI00131CDBF4|nr:ankyrin repeat domain-containing protein [Acidobacterium sp. S8]
MSESLPNAVPTRRLPQQPSLEQLKKQAKDLLERYRAHDPATVAEIQQFERKPDPATFALHDAQRVLARAYGYPSWAKLKAFVDGVNVVRFMEAVKIGDAAQVRKMLVSRSELVDMDVSANDEHRAIHFAVLRRDTAMVRLLMEAGSDARKGIFPHRDATSAFSLARDRDYGELVAIIEEEERQRRAEMSCPNATVSPVQDEISSAIMRGDRDTAMRLLDADRSLIQACDRDGATPLHIAAQQTDVELIAWLLKRRANVRKKDLHDLMALDRAALAAGPGSNQHARRFPDIARLLLEGGAEMTIYVAVALADAPRVRTLISTNPEVLRRIGTWSGGLLTLAVNYGHLEIASLLLDLGADVDERVMLEELETPALSWGMPLWCAALAGNFAMVKLLLDRGADPNANVYASGWPLNKAWNHKDESVKNLLLERGAKRTPYMVAETHDVNEATRLLKADPSEEVIQELLWSAADHGCPEIVALALPHLKWPLDDPRWHWVLIQPPRGTSGGDADNEGQFRCMALLLQHGIDPNITRFGQTVLHFTAARQGGLSDEDRAHFASMLLDHGARPDLRDDLLRSTPLGWACRWGRPKLAQLLIERGAPVKEPDAEPWATPEAWAAKMKHDAVLELLRRNR